MTGDGSEGDIDWAAAERRLVDRAEALNMLADRGRFPSDGSVPFDVAFELIAAALGRSSLPTREEIRAEAARDGCVGSMTPERCVFFLERFKRDELMLGPHEQWALDFAIRALMQRSGK